jgi:hypothetical protein
MSGFNLHHPDNMQKNSAQSASTTPPTQEDISRRAATLWTNYGRPEGRDQEIWLEAERQLLGVDKSVEGRNNTSIVAFSFDESTASGKPKSRSEKPATPSVRKSGKSAVRSRR